MTKSSMYGAFETDKVRETEGVYLDYGDFRVLIGYAGPSNKKYTKYAEGAMRPVRRAMETGTLSNERSMAIMIDIYVKTIILGWEVAQKDSNGAVIGWVEGIEDRDGNTLEASAENISNALRALPALFVDIQNQSSSIALFRSEQIEADSGN